MNTYGFTRRQFLAAGLATGAMASTAWAAFPEKPIRWVVGAPPGGATDFACPRSWPTLFHPDRAAGRCRKQAGCWELGGRHGRGAVTPSDGYTVMGADNAAHVINPVVYRNLQYDPDRDFRPVGLYAFINLLLVVKADSPIRTAAEFLETSRTAKDPVPYASPGI